MIAENSNIPAGNLGPNCVDINNFKTQICDIMLVPQSDGNRSNPQSQQQRGRGQRRP